MPDNASKDENGVSSLLGVSSTDGSTPVPVYADPDTHRLLVDGLGATGPTGPSGVAVADGVYTPVASITVSGGVIISIGTA